MFKILSSMSKECNGDYGVAFRLFYKVVISGGAGKG